MPAEGPEAAWLVHATSLQWTVKETFVGYVQKSGGSVTVVEPASVGSSGFAFPLVAQGESFRAFGGGVVFGAHGGALTVVIAEPAIVVAGAEMLLMVADARSSGPDAAPRAIAHLRADGVEEGQVHLTPTLTIAGSALFGMSYPEGLALDPIVLGLERP
jgi:hypothetical protein